MRDPIASWQKILAQGFSSSSDLLTYLDLPVDAQHRLAEMQFKTRVPLSFAARMQRGNPHDPLLKQVLAVNQELVVSSEYVKDPLNENSFNVLPGLLHKYHGRVLLTVTGACAVNCRYCFRRHFAYQNNNPHRQGWGQVIDYIMQDVTIKEVILSGGDPLLAKDEHLRDLFRQLRTIPHLTTLRIHSRIPIVLPERIDDAFLEMLSENPWHTLVVLHSNHAQELDAAVEQACSRLKKIGCHLLNQSVLLKDINDNEQILADLSWRLLACGVLPYYLHVLDKVQGAAHFDVEHRDAVRIYSQLQAMVPGYLLPRLAREEDGQKHKTLLK